MGVLARVVVGVVGRMKLYNIKLGSGIEEVFSERSLLELLRLVDTIGGFGFLGGWREVLSGVFSFFV